MIPTRLLRPAVAFALLLGLLVAPVAVSAHHHVRGHAHESPDDCVLCSVGHLIAQSDSPAPVSAVALVCTSEIPVPMDATVSSETLRVPASRGPPSVFL